MEKIDIETRRQNGIFYTPSELSMHLIKPIASSRTIVSILDRGILAETDIINWLKGFSVINKIGRLPEDSMASINTKNFMRSLYFRLLKNEYYEKYTQIIKEVIDSISNFS